MEVSSQMRLEETQRDLLALIPKPCVVGSNPTGGAKSDSPSRGRTERLARYRTAVVVRPLARAVSMREPRVTATSQRLGAVVPAALRARCSRRPQGRYRDSRVDLPRDTAGLLLYAA